MPAQTLHRCCAAVVLAAVACGPSVASDGDGDGGATSVADASASGAMVPTDGRPPGDSRGDASGSTSGFDEPGGGDLDLGGLPPIADCDCAEAPLDGFEPGCSYDALFQYGPPCSLPLLCEEVWVECSRAGFDLYGCETEWVYAEDAQICALQALRDRTPGVLYIQGTNDFGIFSSAEIHVVRIRQSGELTINSCMSTDVGAQWFPTTAHAIADGSYYAGCMDLPTAGERHACLLGGLEGRATELPACQ